jgi:hypothetical protein
VVFLISFGSTHPESDIFNLCPNKSGINIQSSSLGLPRSGGVPAALCHSPTGTTEASPLSQLDPPPSSNRALSFLENSLSLPDQLLLVTPCLLHCQVTHFYQETSYGLTLMGPSLEAVKDYGSFFAAAEDLTTETSDVGRESFSLGLLTAGCLRLSSIVHRQG